MQGVFWLSENLTRLCLSIIYGTSLMNYDWNKWLDQSLEQTNNGATLPNSPTHCARCFLPDTRARHVSLVHVHEARQTQCTAPVLHQPRSHRTDVISDLDHQVVNPSSAPVNNICDQRSSSCIHYNGFIRALPHHVLYYSQ